MKTDAQGRGLARLSKSATAIVNGEVDVTDWDDEELLRGQRRNRNGKWTGKPPSLLPAQVVQELTKRRFRRAHALLADSLVDAVQMLRAVINDGRASNTERIKAAEIIMDRVLGRAKETVDLSITSDLAPWQRMMAEAVTVVGTQEQTHALPAGEVIDAEIVEDATPLDFGDCPGGSSCHGQHDFPDVVGDDGTLYPPGWDGWKDDA